MITLQALSFAEDTRQLTERCPSRVVIQLVQAGAQLSGCIGQNAKPAHLSSRDHLHKAAVQREEIRPLRGPVLDNGTYAGPSPDVAARATTSSMETHHRNAICARLRTWSPPQTSHLDAQAACHGEGCSRDPDVARRRRMKSGQIAEARP